MQRMTGFKGRCSRSVFALASLVLLLASPTDQALAQHKIIEGFVSHGALQWPEYIATEFGWFKEHGLEVDMLVVGAGAAQQVAAGALNIAYSDPRFHPRNQCRRAGQDRDQRDWPASV